jgi:hypothetical protein
VYQSVLILDICLITYIFLLMSMLCRFVIFCSHNTSACAVEDFLWLSSILFVLGLLKIRGTLGLWFIGLHELLVMYINEKVRVKTCAI